MRLDVDARSLDVGRGDAIGIGEECAASRDGSVLCWPRSFLDGPIGVPEPRLVPGISDATAVTVGHGFACALLGSGGIACWGRNFAGHLGDGTLDDAERPTRVVGIGDAVEVVAGGAHACAVRAGGQLVCWGRNDRGQLGIASDIESSPVPVALELP